MYKVKFITTASNPEHPGLQKLRRSLDHFGWESVFLIAPWKGYASKFIETYNYLKSGAEDDTDLIVYSDSYDSLVLCSPEEVIKKYMADFYPNILYYAERACWPYGEWSHLYPKVENTPYKHLNGGGFIGTPKQYMELVEIEFPEYSPQFNDQVHSTKLFLTQNHKAKIELDNYCKIFQCVAHAGPADFKYENGRLINNITGETPCFLHFNGHCLYERLIDLQVCWNNSKDSHKEMAEYLHHKTNSVPVFKEYRDFIETNTFGHGERCFYWMWKLIIDELPQSFTFLEIGIHKGQTLGLMRLLADMAGKSVARWGISPMDGTELHIQSDFYADVEKLHNTFSIEKDYAIIEGLSTDPVIIKAAKELSLDVLYIDGGHDYQTVKSDIDNYIDLVKPGGFLVIDDACNEMDLPQGYFGGIQSVTDAVLDKPLPNDEFEFLFSVVHNKVYRRK